MLKLEFPSEEHREMYNTLIQGWSGAEGTLSPGRLFSGNNFDEFLEIIQWDLDKNTQWVNSHIYFLVYTENILGAIQIRHHINHPNLVEDWWHIWYGIAPKYRKKWYATQMLQLWLEKSKELWLTKVLVTCDLDNIWSSKVILKNGWIFERETKGWKKRYWIDIN